MTSIIDYGVGNLFSLKSSLEHIGEEVPVTGDRAALEKSDRIILPGVGAFADAADKLKKTGLREAVLDAAASGKPLLGICLGMQLLFEKSYEYGVHDGLGLVPGSVKPIENVIPKDYKIPHIGWNSLRFPEDKEVSPIFKDINEGDFVYFVHSYYAVCPDEYLTADTEYGARLTAAVQNKNVFGTQFHPEKSGGVGLKILKAFTALS